MAKITLRYFILLALSFFHTYHVRASKRLGPSSYNVFVKGFAFASEYVSLRFHDQIRNSVEISPFRPPSAVFDMHGFVEKKKKEQQ